MKQSKNWCFTDFEILEYDNIFAEYSDLIRYMCQGKEICPKTKKEHIQGWIQFKTKKRMSRVKKILGTAKIHLEPCRGNEFDNDKYCKKDNNYKIYGKFISQGHRTDLETALKIIRSDKGMDKIEEEVPNLILRYSTGLKELIRINQKKLSKKFRKINTELLYGNTGTGKTRYAVEKNNDYYMITGDSLKWWDGYQGEKTLIIDEYNNDVPITKMLNLLDGYQLRLPIKGGFTYARWTQVYITSNLSPDEIHSNAKPKHRDALWRRIQKKTHFKILSSPKQS